MRWKVIVSSRRLYRLVNKEDSRDINIRGNKVSVSIRRVVNRVCKGRKPRKLHGKQTGTIQNKQTSTD